MKTSEFIRRVKELGYETVDKNVDRIRVHRDSGIVAMVFENKANALDTYCNDFIPSDLFDLCVEYAKTPIEERKDVKKYYLYNPIRKAYFNYDVLSKTYYWLDPSEKRTIQTRFTEEEIKNHKFGDIMELLVKEEVEDE